MKKTFISMALALAAVGASAAPRTAAQALDIARRFASEAPGFTNIHSAMLTLAPTATVQMAKGNGASAPAYYVCNIENGGFVIVSGDDRFKDILGYSANGTYDESNMPDGFAYWMQFLSNEMSVAIANGYEPGNITTPTYSATINKSVEPLLTSKWNQNKPYNDKVGGNMTGCVATGMAQVMRYWKYPEHGIGSHTNANSPSFSANFAAETYDWNNMLDTYETGWESKQEVDAVSTLMLHIGVATDMLYGVNESATANLYAAYALVKTFAYNKNLYVESRDHVSYGAWKSLIIDQLQSGHPLCYSGQGKQPNGKLMGHFFVCDGYDAASGKFHFNWGWAGMYDGYYELSSLEPGTGGAGAGAGSYNLMQQIFVNVQPDECGTPSVHFDANNVSMTASNRILNVKVSDIENNNTANLKGTIGIAVYTQNGTLQHYIAAESFPMDNFNIGATYHDQYPYSADMGNIAAGTYTICSAVQMDGIDGVFPIRANYENTTYYTMTVSASGITVAPQSRDINLSCESPEQLVSNDEGNVFQNRVAQFKVVVKNNSAQDFNDEIGIKISRSRGNSTIISVPAAIPAGETKTIDVQGIIPTTLNINNGYTAKAVVGNNGTYSEFGIGITVNVLEEAAGVQQIELSNDNADAATFNILGQRIGKNVKGIVISNGKKSINK